LLAAVYGGYIAEMPGIVACREQKNSTAMAGKTTVTGTHRQRAKPTIGI
jgi:hypothetical protein